MFRIASAQPVASFIANVTPPVCSPAFIDFENNSTGEGPLQYVWQFGINNSTDTAEQVGYLYDSCGTFTVILMVTDTFGLTDSDTQDVYIACNPEIQLTFTPAIVCDTAEVTFVSVSNPSDSIISWIWNFGDPLSGAQNSSVLENPTHYYDDAGEFVITLTVMSFEGCAATSTDTLLLFDPQSYFALTDSACVNDTAFFIDLSTSQDSITEWSWNFDDPTSGANVSIKQNPTHVYNTAGDYNVRLTITTENGCISALKKKIHVYGLPDISAGNDVTICHGDTVQLSASGGLTYSWSPAEYLDDAFVATPLAFPISTIDFTVTGSDSNSCSDTDTIRVSISGLPSADAGNDTSICDGMVASLHGTGGINYLWSPAAFLDDNTISDPTAFPTATTTFTLTVTDSIGCSAIDSVVITVLPMPIVTITNFSGIFCTNSASVELIGNPAGGVFSGEGVSNGVFFPDSLSAGGPYLIDYFYIDSIGCSGSDTVTAFITAPAFIAMSIEDSILCLNELPVSFDLIPPGGILTGNGIDGFFFNPALAGTGLHIVYYMANDSNNCALFDSAIMQVLGLPEIVASQDTFICFGDSIQISASGGMTYNWMPTAFLSDYLDDNPIAFPVATTQFTVTGTDSNQCMNSDSVMLLVFNTLAAEAGLNDTICAGDSTQLVASGGDKYSWLPTDGLSAANISNPMASPSATTMYTVTVNPGSSCPGTDSVLILVNAIPEIITSADPLLCAGDSVPLNAEGAIVYAWTPAETLNDSTINNPVAFPDTTTIYTVTGTDLNGCTDSSEVLVTVMPLPDIDAGTDSSICFGDTLQLAATGGNTYQWTPEEYLSESDIAIPLAFPDSTTTFYLKGTSASGCTSHDSVIIYVLTAEGIDAGIDTGICFGDSIMLHASGGNQFTWTPSSSLSDAFSENPWAYPDATTVYTVTVGVDGTCSFTDTVTIQVNQLPVIDAGIDTVVCFLDSIQLHATGAASYIWIPASYLSDPNIAEPFASPEVTTIYEVTGIDSNGCTSSDSITISIQPLPEAYAGNDTAICAGDSVTLQAAGGINYQWQSAQYLSDTLVSDPVANPDTTATFIVKVGDAGGCFAFDTVLVVVHPLPLANAGQDQQVCAGLATQLNASGGEVFLWVPETGLSSAVINNPTATLSSSIMYIVYVTDTNKCTDSDTIRLEVVPPLETTISGDTTICQGGAAQLLATGGAYYFWSPSNTLDDAFIQNPLAFPDSTSVYSAIVSDGLCYEDTLQVTVVVSIPVINAGENATVVPGTFFQLEAEASAGIYSWTPSENLSCADCLNPIATLLATTVYTVTVTDSAGCTASDDITLSVNCTAESLFIPNAFSPDKNGHNDLLLVRSTGTIDLNYLRIFDRWGKVIFESKDITLGWDGTYNGAMMPAGVYLYTMQASCGGGNVISKQGNITLLR